MLSERGRRYSYRVELRLRGRVPPYFRAQPWLYKLYTCRRYVACISMYDEALTSLMKAGETADRAHETLRRLATL